ncbi:hypothetical protein Ate01nite_36020 [Actinoplanes teichomyceticus]|nr:hypothetical protein Ate01nite_36020 [Actinoplanes teichomyceticus]
MLANGRQVRAARYSGPNKRPAGSGVLWPGATGVRDGQTAGDVVLAGGTGRAPAVGVNGEVSGARDPHPAVESAGGRSARLGREGPGQGASRGGAFSGGDRGALRERRGNSSPASTASVTGAKAAVNTRSRMPEAVVTACAAASAVLS